MKFSHVDTLVTGAIFNDKATSVSPFDLRKITKKPVFDYGFRQSFMPPEFNLTEVGVIEDVEAYVRQSFQKKTALMFKEGEEFRGKNNKTIEYIKRRLQQIATVTSIPWRTLLRDTGYSLISKSNFFWVIVRSESSSGGKKVGSQPPIAAYFPMAPEVVEVKKDRLTGEIVSWRQRMPDGRIHEYDPKEILHVYAYRKTGYTFGTPAIVPVKDDIRTLRRIEENVELLIYQTLFPIFHYKVGTELKPAGQIRSAAGELVDEVDWVKLKISQLPSEGGIVTPERHEIKYIGAEGKALRAEQYLEYFKKRVFAGLGISAIDVGEGETSNRSTADSMSRTLIDSVKDYQDILEEFINSQIIIPLLREANFSFDVLAEENIVRFKFCEIDLEHQLKKNVNAQLLYNGNLIDINEARLEASQEPIAPEQEKFMFSNRVTIPEMKIKIKSAEKLLEMNLEAQTKIASKQLEVQKQQTDMGEIAKAHVAAGTTTTKVARSPTGGSSKTITKVHKSVLGKIKQLSAPANQHGTKTGPQKSLKDSYSFSDNAAKFNWRAIKNEVLHKINANDFDRHWIDTLIEMGLARTRQYYETNLLAVTRKVFASHKQKFDFHTEQDMKHFINKRISFALGGVKEVIKKKVFKELDKASKMSITKEILLTNLTEIFDSLEHRSDFFHNTELNATIVFSTASAFKSMGERFVEVELNEECEDCVNQPRFVELNNDMEKHLPPHHVNCECQLKRSCFTKDEQDCILGMKTGSLESDIEAFKAKKE